MFQRLVGVNTDSAQAEVSKTEQEDGLEKIVEETKEEAAQVQEQSEIIGPAE